MSSHVVRSTVRGGRVHIIELARPESRNALTPGMLSSLEEAFLSFDEGDGAVLLCGAGGYFSAGVDGKSVMATLQHGWSSAFEELLEQTRRTLKSLLDCPRPVVAAVDGPAAGAGVTYALLSDVRLVTTRTRLLPGHLTMGSPLDGGSSYALSEALGSSGGMALLLSPQGLDAEDLLRMRLAHGRSPLPAGAREDMIDITAELAEVDSQAVKCARDLLRRMDFDSQWEAEVVWLRWFVESGRLAENMDRYWTGRRAGADR